MTFIVLFEDNPQADPDIRKRHMPDHLAFLTANASSVCAAGPLYDSEGGGRGGLWVVDADDETAVERLVHDDPFWPTGLRNSFTVLRWHQVFAEGRRLITPG